MPFHEPGHPDDLTHPSVIWALAVFHMTFERGTVANGWNHEHWVRDSELQVIDGGGRWWRMVRIEGGRYLIVGWERSSGTLYEDDQACLDLLAGAPDWIPWEWAQRVDDETPFGFAYWWDGRRWGRAGYPDQVDSDGLDVQLGGYVSAESHLAFLVERLEIFWDLWDEHEPSEEEFEQFMRPIVERVAEAPVEADWICGALLDVSVEFEKEKVLEVLGLGGMIAGAPVSPGFPAGTGRPADRPDQWPLGEPPLPVVWGRPLTEPA
ncbi:hypothetical protein NE857_30970 [Nocardiopsis exhalans]|uniref:Uncharacterized protein n=1 Tax=Nocardiopsis exhalans TaxID=163604 RepID=A0ABY5D9G7_9ACTN|nr:hypothetical protein [Nocardiopsis exhalans]USY19610.1 hypothetical protein NE857_30970 [Nocardiopsis exhalans]